MDGWTGGWMDESMHECMQLWTGQLFALITKTGEMLTKSII